MNNEMTNKPPFKVKCVIVPSSGTLTKDNEYEVVSVVYLVDDNYYQVSNNEGNLNWYFASRFEIVETSVANPEYEHKFSVGDNR